MSRDYRSGFASAGRQPSGRRGWLPRWLNRDITLLIALQALYSLTVGYLPIIVPLYLVAIGFGAVELGFLMTSVAILGALFAVATGLASDRFGYKKVIVGSSFLVAAGTL